MFTSKELHKLSKQDKKALAAIMHSQGYPFRTLEEYLGADFTTLAKWAKEKIPDEVRQRVTTLYLAEIEEHNKRGLARVYKRLEELIPKEKDIGMIIKAGEFFRGKPAQTNQTNVQVNFSVTGKQAKEEYGDI